MTLSMINQPTGNRGGLSLSLSFSLSPSLSHAREIIIMTHNFVQQVQKYTNEVGAAPRWKAVDTCFLLQMVRCSPSSVSSWSVPEHPSDLFAIVSQQGDRSLALITFCSNRKNGSQQTIRLHTANSFFLKVAMSQHHKLWNEFSRVLLYYYLSFSCKYLHKWSGISQCCCCFYIEINKV